jgi:hypothetical protein
LINIIIPDEMSTQVHFYFKTTSAVGYVFKKVQLMKKSEPTIGFSTPKVVKIGYKIPGTKEKVYFVLCFIYLRVESHKLDSMWTETLSTEFENC